jgi:hypothetical protein
VTRALERKDYSVPNEDGDRWGSNAASTVTQ